MSKLSRKGTPEQLKALVEQKIEDLSSCDKTEGTEIQGSDDVTTERSYDEILEEVRQGYEDRGYDVNDETVKAMINDTASYIDIAPDDYTVDQWFEDTQKNYPEYLDPNYYDTELQDEINSCTDGESPSVYKKLMGSDIVATEPIEDKEDTPDVVNAAEEDETLPGVSKSEIISWLSEHDQAWEDALDYFGSVDLSEIDKQDIIDWMYEHDQLWEDFNTYLDSEDEEEPEVTDDYLFDFIDKLREDIFGESPVVDDVDIDLDSGSEILFVTVTLIDDMGELSAYDYEVPYSDLSGIPEDDSDYIISEIDGDIMDFEG